MKYKTLPIAFILCTAVLAGCGSSGGGEVSSAATSSDLASYDPNSVAVETSIAKKGSIEEKSMFSGTVQPIKTVDVASPRTGVKVTSVNFDVGDSVKAGDVLFSLDTTDIQNNILKKGKKNMWGARTFDEGKTAAETRNYRGARRRIQRRKNERSWYSKRIL